MSVASCGVVLILSIVKIYLGSVFSCVAYMDSERSEMHTSRETVMFACIGFTVLHVKEHYKTSYFRS